MTSKLIAENRGSTGYLVLNAPSRRNALSLDMWQAIPPAIESFAQDTHIRSIVITGAGEEAFAAGADISEFDNHRATADSAKAYDTATQAALVSIIRCDKPVIAAIKGICFGGGMALAMSCDLRLSTQDAKFRIPAARLGIGYGVDGTAALVARLGPALAAEILFTGRIYSASEALAKGIVHALAPNAELDALIAQYTSMIAENAPLSITAAKKSIHAAVSGSTGDRRAAEQSITACMTSADYAEGRTAFLEKRKPHFQGR